MFGSFSCSYFKNGSNSLYEIRNLVHCIQHLSGCVHHFIKINAAFLVLKLIQYRGNIISLVLLQKAWLWIRMCNIHHWLYWIKVLILLVKWILKRVRLLFRI